MEAKELLEALNLPTDIDTKEKLVETFRKSYIPLAEAHEDEEVKKKITGAIYGSLNTEAKRLFGLSKEEIEGKQFKDILKLGHEKVSQKIAELEEKAGQGNDEKLSKLQKDYEKIAAQKTQYETDLAKVLEEKTHLQNNFEKQLKDFKINSLYKEKKSKLPFAEAIPEAAKIGFDAIVQSKYVFDFDEKGDPIVLDKEGKKIAKKDKAGEYMGIDEVLEMELDVNGLKKKNNMNGNQRFDVNINNNNSNNGEPPKRVAKVHPAAAKAAETYKQQ